MAAIKLQHTRQMGLMGRMGLMGGMGRMGGVGFFARFNLIQRCSRPFPAVRQNGRDGRIWLIDRWLWLVWGIESQKVGN